MAIKLPKPKEIKAAVKSEAKRFADLSAADKGAFEQALYKWQAPLYINKHKPWWWYLAALGVIGSLIAYGILSGAWTFALAVVVFTGVYYYFQYQDVPVVEITFSTVGVMVGKKVYPYSMFRTFWVDYHPPHTQDLHLIPNNNYKYELTIHLNGQKPGEIKDFLQQYLPEWVDRQKSITESVIHLIGL